jgi:hypothetical protein
VIFGLFVMLFGKTLILNDKLDIFLSTLTAHKQLHGVMSILQNSWNIEKTDIVEKIFSVIFVRVFTCGVSFTYPFIPFWLECVATTLFNV